MSATFEVAAFARQFSLWNAPKRARAVARTGMLDLIACAIAGRGERVAREVRDWCMAEGACDDAAIWGTDVRTSASRAAFANGTAGHALDYDDVSWAMNGHPTAPLLPAALAVAEARGASGADLVAAFVAGFEVQARIGQALSISHYARGWHPTATLGALGATVAAGRLLGLDERGFRIALGLAASQLAGSRMNFGMDAKPLHAGWAAQTGVVSAELARRGLTAREDALDCEMGIPDLYAGHHPIALPPLGLPFALLDPGLELKPYPSCRFTHRTIDAVLALRARHAQEELASIECSVDPFALKILIHPRPTTGLEAKFSLPYCAAVAWLDGRPTLGSFDDARAVRDDVQELLSRVGVREGKGEADEVSIVLASGFRATERVELARGNPQNPMTDGERLEKVRACVAPALGRERAQELIGAVEGLEKLPDVRALTRLLVPAREPRAA